MAPSKSKSCSETSDSSSETDVQTTTKVIKLKTKRKTNAISVCLTNCRYDVVRRIVNKFDYRAVNDADNWNLYWTDYSITVDRCKEMKRYQKINHFPGMLEICRKDLLARNLNRMLRLFPRDYNYFPRTWCLPADLGEALAYSRLRKNKTFILKPDAGSQGRGIFVTKSLKEVKPCDRGVCQVYLSRPFLIDGYKFDLRIYVLITSCDPLRIYIYDEGLVRFATCKYKEPNQNNITNVFMHLTNYAVNKYSRTYNQDVQEGSKRKLTWFNDYLDNLGHDVSKLWSHIDDIIIKTIISAAPILKHSYAACFPNHDIIPACCELLGVDIILDRRLNPLILEINHSPSFHTDTTLDSDIKEGLLTDMFNMLNLEYCDKKRVMREDKKRVRERLLHGVSKEPSVVATSSTNTSRSFDDYYKYEHDHSGNFRIVYPKATTRTNYAKFFDQGINSLYSETAASRAREAAQNALRNEMQLKAKFEANKIVKRLESSSTANVPHKPPNRIPSIVQTNSQSSLKPQVIVESEEKERLQRLAQRDYLIRSHGILEIVYFAMKRNGHLRPQDERKFAIFDKLRHNNDAAVNRTNGVAITDFMDSINFKDHDNKPDSPQVNPKANMIITIK